MTNRLRWVTAQPWVTLVARLGVAGVLGYAGWTKIDTPTQSVQAVAAYELFGDGLNQFIGHTLPLLEIAMALLLVVGFATRYVGALSALLFAAFIVGIASAWARGLSIDCGCFGDGGPVAPGEENYVTPLLRDLGFLVMAGIVVAWPRSPVSLDHLLGGGTRNRERDLEREQEDGERTGAGPGAAGT
ncbi:DoxX family membrane protein [Spiractinospora alimapuensis]|uniref:DoxX family protein n=1 Tax=Spiractinospora alimapuensis TaxID=2820884 RepID=UPI001F3099DB|nr:MauE/DoxX family redox-associated membrane protein [Spiractinospora alimapuensis]QVQ53088.1 DoxX family membrane protein [Spiractinospora alimapuensis]